MKISSPQIQSFATWLSLKDIFVIPVTYQLCIARHACTASREIVGQRSHQTTALETANEQFSPQGMPIERYRESSKISRIFSTKIHSPS